MVRIRTSILLLTLFFSLRAMDKNTNREPDTTIIKGKQLVRLFINSGKVADESGEAKQKYYAGYTQEALHRHGAFKSLPVFIKKNCKIQIPEFEKKRLVEKLHTRCGSIDYSEYVFAGEINHIFDQDAFAAICDGKYIISQHEVPICTEKGYLLHNIVVANTKKAEDGDALCRQLKRDFIRKMAEGHVYKYHPFNKMRVCIPCDDEHFMEVGKLEKLATIKEYKSNLVFDTYTLCDCHCYVQEDIIVPGVDQNNTVCSKVAVSIQKKLEPCREDSALKRDWILLLEDKS